MPTSQARMGTLWRRATYVVPSRLGHVCACVRACVRAHDGTGAQACGAVQPRLLPMRCSPFAGVPRRWFTNAQRRPWATGKPAGRHVPSPAHAHKRPCSCSSSPDPDPLVPPGILCALWVAAGILPPARNELRRFRLPWEAPCVVGRGRLTYVHVPFPPIQCAHNGAPTTNKVRATDRPADPACP